jgi:hypothetical protein
MAHRISAGKAPDTEHRGQRTICAQPIRVRQVLSRFEGRVAWFFWTIAAQEARLSECQPTLIPSPPHIQDQPDPAPSKAIS